VHNYLNKPKIKGFNMQAPDRKVTIGALAGALVVVLIFGVQQFGIVVPPEVAAAVTTLITFAISYLVPNNA
jgi:hypothetical protein